MKFSVLLPTRNRLEYLRFAVESVRRQDYPDWEIVISDNCSEDDIAGFVSEVGDARIRYVRTGQFLPVTDNWNNALEHSIGDYVVMLGDDDGLLPGYFSTLARALERFPDPDFVYVGALFYAYPGVMPDRPDGFVRQHREGIFPEVRPFWLERERAELIARRYLDFRMAVASNMQFSLISRRKIDECRRMGPFFQSPYPDFYATPALFLTSHRILIYPEPLVVIGITPKSYGYFHFNHRAGEGVQFLNNDAALVQGAETSRMMLPGTSYYDSWLLAMEALYANWARMRGMRPNYRRYRLLQIIHCYKKRFFERELAPDAIKPLVQRMRGIERVYGVLLRTGFTLLAALPPGLFLAFELPLRRLIGQLTFQEQEYAAGSFRNLIELYESLDRSAAPRDAATEGGLIEA